MNELEELAEILADKLTRGKVDRQTVARRVASAARPLPPKPLSKPSEGSATDVTENAFCPSCGLPRLQSVSSACAPNHARREEG